MAYIKRQPESVYFILAPDGTVSVHIPRLENV